LSVTDRRGKTRRPSGEFQNVLAIEHDAAGGGWNKADDRIDRAGFSGSVRTDEQDGFAFWHVDRDAGQRDDAAVTDVQVLDLEQHYDISPGLSGVPRIGRSGVRAGS
jgi:hypothetical protein